MARLTEVAITTRKFVRYGIYFIIFLIVGKIVLSASISIITKIFPPAAPPPTVKFDKLPKLPFPVKPDIPQLTFTVQTPDNTLPVWPNQAKVYFMPPARPDLTALDNAKTKAQSLGFSANPTQITPTLYKFTSTNSFSTLEMNIVTNTFSVGYNLNLDPSPLTQTPPNANEAASIAKNFLTRGSLLPDDLTGPVTQEYLKVSDKRLVSAISLSEANLTKINLFRKDYDKLPSLGPNPNQGNVWFIVSGNQDQGKQIVGAGFFYYPIDETQFSTYPIKNASNALKDLQAGKAYIANLGQNDNGKVTIRRIYLAYYDPDTNAQFYQPIVVFEGDNGFVAYVPAVTSTYYSE